MICVNLWRRLILYTTTQTENSIIDPFTAPRASNVQKQANSGTYPLWCRHLCEAMQALDVSSGQRLAWQREGCLPRLPASLCCSLDSWGVTAEAWPTIAARGGSAVWLSKPGLAAGRDAIEVISLRTGLSAGIAGGGILSDMADATLLLKASGANFWGSACPPGSFSAQAWTASTRDSQAWLPVHTSLSCAYALWIRWLSAPCPGSLEDHNLKNENSGQHSILLLFWHFYKGRCRYV